jgi:cytosine deaminase
MGYLLTVGAHMGTRHEIQQALAMVTEYPARILRLPDYGLHVGAQADLVLWDTERPEEIITALAPPRLVVKRGRITVEHERAVREPWRGPA